MPNLSKEIGNFLFDNSLVLSSAESCTAGLIASKLAETPGSSAWLEGSVVAYSAEVKNKILNVSLQTIEEKNITSCEVASEMAIGLSQLMPKSNILVSTTGVAGPSGGTDDIPVGTVCFAWLFKDENKIFTEKKIFDGNRNEIREKAAEYSLKKVVELKLNLLSTKTKKPSL